MGSEHSKIWPPNRAPPPVPTGEEDYEPYREPPPLPPQVPPPIPPQMPSNVPNEYSQSLSNKWVRDFLIQEQTQPLTWRDIGSRYITNAPPGRPLTPEEEDYFEGHGFYLVKELGRGGFGTVWEVISTALVKDNNNQTVETRHAVKFLSLSTFKGERKRLRDTVDRLKSEGEIQQPLNHRNICHCQYIFHIPDDIYSEIPIHICIFMELCDGNLFNYIQDVGKMDERYCKFWFKQVVAGLQYLHNRNTSHLDLKPQNILYKSKKGFRNDPNKFVYKLTDFGLSIEFQDPNAKTCAPPGTLIYAAPETFTNRDYKPKASDIFSLGLCLAEALSGAQQFGNMIHVLRSRDVFGQYSYLSSDLKCLLVAMTANNPDSRPPIEAVASHRWLS